MKSRVNLFSIQKFQALISFTHMKKAGWPRGWCLEKNLRHGDRYERDESNGVYFIFIVGHSWCARFVSERQI